MKLTKCADPKEQHSCFFEKRDFSFSEIHCRVSQSRCASSPPNYYASGVKRFRIIYDIPERSHPDHAMKSPKSAAIYMICSVSQCSSGRRYKADIDSTRCLLPYPQLILTTASDQQRNLCFLFELHCSLDEGCTVYSGRD